FADISKESGIAASAGKSFGAVATDLNNDGRMDLFVANDTVPNFLFINKGGGKFEEEGLAAGVAFSATGRARSGMGVDAADNDGDLDVLISNNGEPPVLLRNVGGNRNNWIGLQLIGRQSNPAGVGAVISWQAGALKRSRLKTAGGSYLASHDPREVLGLGSAAKLDYVEIRWPSGKIDKLANPPINRYLTVIEGSSPAR